MLLLCVKGSFLPECLFSFKIEVISLEDVFKRKLLLCTLLLISVTSKKSPNVYNKWPQNDFTRK